MAGRRVTLGLGIAAAGGVGYYLYAAGGNPKVAEKKFEHDASSASASLKGSLPGKSKEAKQQGEEWAQQAGAKLDSTVNDARYKMREADAKVGAKMSEADAKLGQLKDDGKAKFEQARKDSGREMNEAIDKFDKTVERKASEAKTGISSWFGLGK